MTDTEPTLPTLETDRLRIRWLTEADVPVLYAIFSDPVAMRYWSHGPFTTVDDAVRYLDAIRQGFASGTLFQWGIERREDGRVVGTCTLAAIDLRNRRAELGYMLARDAWGRGLMGEAVGAVLRHAFGSIGLHRIQADVDPRNEASIRLLERLGFRREGYLRECYRLAGEVQDAVLYALLRPEAEPLLSPDPGGPGASPTG